MTLTEIHSFLRSKTIFTVFTWFTRILLAIAFLPSGLKKLQGLRFTTIGIDNPVGFFFEALFRTGYYWNFLGLMQLTAAILLLIPRTAFLGAFLYFPIVVNIFIIVTAMNFKGTPIIAGLMLIANLYLFFWDYPKTKIIIQTLFKKL